MNRDELLERAAAWLARQCDGLDCRTCGAAEGNDHEPTDPCGLVAELAAALRTAIAQRDDADARAVASLEAWYVASYERNSLRRRLSGWQASMRSPN